MVKEWSLITLLLTIFVGACTAAADPKIKVCDGARRPDAAFNPQDHYTYIKKKYRGCTHIVNHLSLIKLRADQNISFLSSIVEVGGSVFIKFNIVRVIPLSNLRVIHGRQCGHERDEKHAYSLVIDSNSAPKGEPAYVDLRSLVAIKKCKVLIKKNRGFCFLNTIMSSNVDVLAAVDQPIKFEDGDAICPAKEICSSKCPLVRGKRYCYGPNPDMCVQVSQYPGKCHQECIGGCTGESNSECRACRNYQSGNQCVHSCPSSKFAYLGLCVDACPKRHLTYQGKCLTNCPVNTYPKDGRCEKCCGSKCNEVCRVQEIMNRLASNISVIRIMCMDEYKNVIQTPRSLLRALMGCTIVDGDIMFTSLSSYSTILGNESIRQEDFQNLKNIKHINGNLYIDLKPYNITNLSFLSKLESINAPTQGYGLVIVSSPSLRYLGLTNLRRVNSSTIYVKGNKQLCYLENLCSRFGSSVDRYIIRKNKRNCGNEVCDKQCFAKNGCWGPGQEMCVQWPPRSDGMCR